MSPQGSLLWTVYSYRSLFLSQSRAKNLNVPPQREEEDKRNVTLVFIKWLERISYTSFASSSQYWQHAHNMAVKKKKKKKKRSQS